MSVKLTLPVPPSTNNLYRGGPRYKTDEYKAWIHDAGWLVRAQHPGSLPDKVPLRCKVELPIPRKRDTDNLKAIGDLLKRLGIIGDDRWIDEWRIRRVPVGQPLVVDIRAMEASDGAV